MPITADRLPAPPPVLSPPRCCAVCGGPLRVEEVSGQAFGAGRRRVYCEPCVQLLLALRDALREDAGGDPAGRGNEGRGQ